MQLLLIDAFWLLDYLFSLLKLLQTHCYGVILAQIFLYLYIYRVAIISVLIDQKFETANI